jgi:TolA-binding protein
MRLFRTHGWILPVLTAAVFCSGCVSIWRFKETEKRLEALEKQNAGLEEDRKRDRDAMERLHQDLLAGTEALRKGGANLGADLDAVRSDLARAKGTNEEFVYKLVKLQEDVDLIKKALDDKFGLALVQLPKGLPQDKDGLYKSGKAAVDKGDLTTGRGVLRKYLDTYPDDAQAATAQFLIGETYFKESKWGQAIREYQRVHDRYRETKGSPVEKSLLRIAECLLKQDDCKKAAGVLKYLSEYNRKAPEADKAKELLKGLKKTCKGL